MTVLEILLGNKNESRKIGLETLLKNRCAYLIAKTPTERENILESFKKIYDIRSDILHNGKHKLSYDDKRCFIQLQELCGRIIKKEIEMLQEQIRINNKKPQFVPLKLLN